MDVAQMLAHCALAMEAVRGNRTTWWIAFVAAVLAGACDSVAEPESARHSLDLFVGSGAQALAMDRGASIPLTVVVRDSIGQPLATHSAVALVSRNPSVVIVNDAAVVTGKAAGSTFVVATMREASGVTLADSMAITVVAPSP
jgi:hypothetical protein